MLRIPVIKATQRDFTIYIGRMTARQLLDSGITTEWDPSLGWDLEQQGYQRAPVERHYRQIGRFLAREGEPLMPTAALLAARESELGLLPFEEIPDSGGLGHITIPDGRYLCIVDYQHRWRGLRYAIEDLKAEHLQEFIVPVVILADAPIFEEIRQFYLVNNKQKRIDTDLALTLMQAMATESDLEELYNLAGPGNRFRIRATRLVAAIAGMPNTPWTGRIAAPNVRVPSQVASLKSFVDSLRPLVSARSPVRDLDDPSLVAVIVNYWMGIKQVMPGPFASPEQYSIQKSPGLFVMHRVAAAHVFPLCISNLDFAPDSVAGILRKSQTYMADSFWQTGGPVAAYSSPAGHRELASQIVEEIKKSP
ncbi:MAG: DGQHR domain-containing protein [Chloroflexi bacterium]|nr:DGQHR domain-containing protein [Chloroflexota bacterium]